MLICSKVIVYLLFWAPQPLGRGQVGVGGYLGTWGVSPYTHTCMHACTHVHAHVKKLQMATTCLSCCPHVVSIISMSSSSSPHHLNIIYKVPTSSPTPQIATTPTPQICDLLRYPHLWVGVWVVGWMGGLICGGVNITKNQIKS